jgi:tol-pal system protein YbgF
MAAGRASASLAGRSGAPRPGLGTLPAGGRVFAACTGRRCGGPWALVRILILGLVLLVPAALRAQDAKRLADIQADLDSLGADIASLRQELVASGSGGTGQLAGSALDRMNALEDALARLTDKTETLEARINRIVADGTNRLGDLQFRVCELEPGCDISKLGDTPVLGGTGDGAVPPPQAGGDSGGGTELAVGEKGDFDRARAVLDQGDFQRAADLFATFAETYPGSPLMGEADYWRGEALKSLGDTAGAARAWLASFSDAPQGPKAADALLNLGIALGELGQSTEACVTLGEVPARYPGSAAASQAAQERLKLACG